MPYQGQPATSIDKNAIVRLADSIKTDGVLQNLIVEKAGEDKFRVVSGSRRYLALRLLKSKRIIDGDYKVPVEIRALDGDDALRIRAALNSL